MFFCKKSITIHKQKIDNAIHYNLYRIELAGNVKMEYVVFEDLQSKKYITNPNDLPVKIHKKSCRFYVNRDVNATTVRWHGPFDTFDKAQKRAQQIGKPSKRAQCCP